jgi:hypothetical protein
MAEVIDWKYWKSLNAMSLWEAVALIVEIAPDTVARDGPYGRMIDFERFPNESKIEDFQAALERAERATTTSGPIRDLGPSVPMGKKLTTEVALREVVAFFSLIQWPAIPADLLDLIDPPKAAYPPESVELKARERGTLLRILYGMATQGYKYDPTCKRSAVPSEIAADCEFAGCSVDADSVRKYLKEAANAYGHKPNSASS